MPDPTPDPATIAARITALLAARSWTRYRLAVESGLAQSAVRKLCRGDGQTPEIGTLVRVARALGVTVDELLR